jgi:hypothetical protein
MGVVCEYECPARRPTSRTAPFLCLLPPQDPVSKIRFAVINTIGLFCHYQAPLFQQACTDKLLSVFMPLLRDPSGRVRVRACCLAPPPTACVPPPLPAML